MAILQDWTLITDLSQQPFPSPGGVGSDKSLLTSVEYFDGATFRPGPRLSYGSSGHCSTRLNATHFALLGGKGAGAQDFLLLSEGGWTRMEQGLPGPRQVEHYWQALFFWGEITLAWWKMANTIFAGKISKMQKLSWKLSHNLKCSFLESVEYIRE